MYQNIDNIHSNRKNTTQNHTTQVRTPENRPPKNRPLKNAQLKNAQLKNAMLRSNSSHHMYKPFSMWWGVAHIQAILLLQFGTGAESMSEGLGDTVSLHKWPALLSLLQNQTSFSAEQTSEELAQVN